MPYRHFSDRRGRQWEVWAVVPELMELRRSDRRTLPDRRRAPRSLARDRRVGERRTTLAPLRARLPKEFDHGWLCFSSQLEKRRLAPIPVDWAKADTSQLELWAYQAKLVGKPCDEV